MWQICLSSVGFYYRYQHVSVGRDFRCIRHTSWESPSLSKLLPCPIAPFPLTFPGQILPLCQELSRRHYRAGGEKGGKASSPVFARKANGWLKTHHRESQCGPCCDPHSTQPRTGATLPSTCPHQGRQTGSVVVGGAEHAGKHLLVGVVQANGERSAGAGEHIPAPRRRRSVCIEDTMSGAPCLRQGGDEMT